MGVSVFSLAAVEKQARGSEFPPVKTLEELEMGRKETRVST